VGDRLDQYDFFQSEIATCQNCAAAPFVPLPTLLRRQLIHHAKTNVVPRARIFRAWIAQANNQFHAVYLTTKLQAHRQELRQASIDDLLLCLLEIIRDAIKLEALLGIVNHKGGAWVAIARLPDSARVDDGAIANRRFPVALRR